MLTCALVARSSWFFQDAAASFGSPDEAEYDILARRIFAGEGFALQTGKPTAWRTPGFPLVLGLIYWISGQDHNFARIVLVVVTSLTAPLLYGICLLLFERRFIALLVGLSWAVLPNSIRMAGWLLGEESAALILALALLLTILAERWRSLPFACLAGLLLGWAILTRGYLLPLVIAPPVWLILRRSRSLAVVLLATTAIVLGSWMVRNAVSLKAFTLSTETPEVLWLGNSAWARGACPGDLTPLRTYIRQKYPEYDGLSEAGRSRIYAREAFYEVTQHPTRILWLLPRKALIFFSPLSSYMGIDWVYAALLPFSLYGVFNLWKEREGRNTLWLLGYPVIGVLIINLMAYGDPRHRHPVDLLILILAGVGVNAFASRFVPLLAGKGQPATD